jgi:hypothetical protein
VGSKAAFQGLIASNRSTPPLSRDSAQATWLFNLTAVPSRKQSRLSPKNIPRGNVAFFADGNLLTRKEKLNV